MFPPAETFTELMSFPVEQARMAIREGHTPANAAELVIDMVQPKMASMWHRNVIDPVFEGVRTTYSGAVALCQDLTVFNVTPGAVITHQARIDPVQHAIVGTSVTERTLDEPLEASGNNGDSWLWKRG